LDITVKIYEKLINGYELTREKRIIRLAELIKELPLVKAEYEIIKNKLLNEKKEKEAEQNRIEELVIFEKEQQREQRFEL
jgi:hypothetical protein